MAGINDIASAVTELMDFVSTSSNMDEIDFDVTERPNGKTSYMRYEYVPEEDEILVRSGRRWGRIVPGGAVSNVLDIDLADIVDGTETEIELTGVDDDWIAAVTGSDYKGLVLTIDEEQVFVPFYNEAQATYMETAEGHIGLGYVAPGEMQWDIFKSGGKWYITGEEMADSTSSDSDSDSNPDPLEPVS